MLSDISIECLTLCALSFKLYDALAFCDDSDDGYNYSDDDTHYDSAGSVHAHDNSHEHDAWAAADDAHHDAEVTEDGTDD